jgi:hypothetical protein
VSSGHRFEIFLVKREQTTFIRGPFWNYFCRTHNIALNDIVTFTLIRPGAQEKAQVGGEEDEDEEGSREGAQEDMHQEDIKVEEGSEEGGADEDMQVEGIIPKVEEGSKEEGDEEEGSEDEGSEGKEFVNTGRHVFQMTSRAPNGDIKEFNYILGMCFSIKYIDSFVQIQSWVSH